MKKLFLIFLVLIGGLILTSQVFGQDLPQTPALFETSLQSPITSTATSMTLVANSIKGGGSLSGYNCFTIDEGSSQWEVVCGTISGTSVTSMTRGIDSLTGTSTDTDLRFAHRRGANVKVTDYPIITILRNILNGNETIANAIKYTSAPTWVYGLQQLVTWDKAKDYTDSVSYAGTSNADTATKGIVQTATSLQVASSTSLGSTGASLYIPASNATSTYNSATAPLKVVVTQNDGKIDSNFIRQSDNFAWSGNNTESGTLLRTASTTLTATTTISASSVTGNALVLNGVASQAPTSNSFGVLNNNGSGVWSWGGSPRYSYVGAGPSSTTGYATTTIITIPNNFLTASSTIRINFSATCLSNGGAGTFYLRTSDGTTLNSISCGAGSNGATTQATSQMFVLFNSSSSQEGSATGFSCITGTTCSRITGGGTSFIDFSTSKILVMVAESLNASNSSNMNTLSVEVNK